MVLHKGKIYISSHGTNAFSGAIYILDDKKYLYPKYNRNQCWGYNIVSNGDELAVSGHCYRIYTGYVEILSQSKRYILMKGINIAEACGFDISWYNGNWWVSCKYKIWNKKDGFIPLIKNIEYPIFQYDNTVLNVFDSNSFRFGNEELNGCYKEDVYDNGNCIVEYKYNNILSKKFKSNISFFGTSLYITNEHLIIGSNNLIHIYKKDFSQNMTIPIPSISNTKFSYLYKDDILYLGSFGSNYLSGIIYSIKYEFDFKNNTIDLSDLNSNKTNINVYIIFISMLFIVLIIFIYCMIKIYCISYFKLNIDKKIRNEKILHGLNTPEMLKEMYNTRYTKSDFYIDDKNSDLPGAYKCY